MRALSCKICVVHSSERPAIIAMGSSIIVISSIRPGASLNQPAPPEPVPTAIGLSKKRTKKKADSRQAKNEPRVTRVTLKLAFLLFFRQFQ